MALSRAILEFALRADWMLLCRMLAESTLNIEISCSKLRPWQAGTVGFGFQNQRFELLSAVAGI